MAVRRIFTKIYIFIFLYLYIFILGFLSKTGQTRVSHRVKMMTRWPGRERRPKWRIPCLTHRPCYTRVAVCMNNTVENDFFGFPKLKWLHLTNEMDKSVRLSSDIFSGFSMQKSLKSVDIWQLFKQYKGGRFGDAVYSDLFSYIGDCCDRYLHVLYSVVQKCVN